jgi:hypothetical protein
MNMRKVSRVIGFTASLMLLGSVANAQGIVGSKHDLTFGSGSTATTEVCVFCHTPHGSDTTAAVPLWNKLLPSTTYQRYSTLNTSTLDGGEAPVGSVSLACLSCHDGTSAIDAVLNMPGSGMRSGQIDSGVFLSDMNAYLGGSATPVPVLGADLRNDHPVSIQYAGGGLDASGPDGLQPTTAYGDPSFKPTQRATINSNPAWWVDSSGGTVAREKTDMILYTRTDGPLGAAEPMVECASCHNPHNASTFIADESVSFLRIPNNNSNLCTTCHDK